MLKNSFLGSANMAFQDVFHIVFVLAGSRIEQIKKIEGRQNACVPFVLGEKRLKNTNLASVLSVGYANVVYLDPEEIGNN